jgi:hypothetical protein
MGRVATREQGIADWEIRAMGTRKRTARQFQVESMEPRWAPGGMSGGVLGDRMTRHIGEEIPQVQVAHVVPLGGASGGALGDRMTCHIGEEIPQ